MNSRTGYEAYHLYKQIQEFRNDGLQIQEIGNLLNLSKIDMNYIYQQFRLLQINFEDGSLANAIAVACQELPDRYFHSIYLALRRNHIEHIEDLVRLSPKQIRNLKGIGPNFRPVLLTLHRELRFTPY